MAVVKDIFGDPWVDINNDGVGDWECGEGDDCYNSPDTDTSDSLNDASKALNIFSRVLDLVKNFLKGQADSDLQKSMNDASNKINRGKDGMIENGKKVSDAMGNLSNSNSNLNNLGSEFASLNSILSSQLASISSLTGDLSGLNSQLASQTLAVQDAQARLDSAMSRTDFSSLAEKRTEIRSANYDLMQKNLSLNETNFNLSNVTETLNKAGGDYNKTLSDANTKRDQIASEYANAQAFKNAVDAGVNKYNQSAQEYTSGFKDLKNGVNDYQNKMGQLATMAEASAGASGTANVLKAIGNGEYATATGNALLSGLGATVRNGDPLGVSSGMVLIGAGTSSATKAIDQAYNQGLSVQQAGMNFLNNMGQATMRTDLMNSVGQGIDLGFTVARNTTNPNNLYDAGTIFAQQVGPVFQIGGQITSTVTSVLPGTQGISPIIPKVAETLGTTLQGQAQTILETGKKIVNGDISVATGNYPPRMIGNYPAPGLVTRQMGGQTSAPTTFGVGTIVSIAEGAKQITLGSFTNQNYANQASSLAKSIADTAIPSSGINTKISSGSFTFRSGGLGDVGPRPPSADPVGGVSVAY